MGNLFQQFAVGIFRSFAASAVAALLLSGCASLTEQQCADGNWESIGHRDAAQGQSSEYRLAAHRRACQKQGIVPNRTAYMTGWNKGVLTYCTPENAYEVGVRGAIPNESICPPSMVGAFVSGFRAGHQVYEWQSQVNRLENEIEQLERRLDNPALARSQRREVRDMLMFRQDSLFQTRSLLFAAQSRGQY